MSELKPNKNEVKPELDAISRQEVIRAIYDNKSNFKDDFAQGFFADKIRELTSVMPQPNTGHWIDTNGGVECDKCGKWYPHAIIAKSTIKFCSECGCRMFEPQESEVSE